MNKFTNLTKPLKIGQLEIRNRMAMAPMSPGMTNAATNEFTEFGLDYYLKRAKGGFGLIYTGAFSVDKTVDPFNPLSPYPMDNLPGFRKTALELNERVNAFGCKIIAQIVFGAGRNYPGNYAPSEVPVHGYPELTAPALTIEQIKEKERQVIEAAKFLKESGFAGVEVHAIHWGYLLDNFAMSITNHRTDEYGGSLENRLRICKELCQGIKEVCGSDYPVTIRLGIKSYLKDLQHGSVDGNNEAGRTIEEAIEIAKCLESYGYDALSVDTGVYESFYYACPPMYVERGYAVELAAQVKQAVNIPVLLGGRMNDPLMAEEAVAQGKIDAIVLGRPSLADPDFPRKIEMNKIEKIRPCIACNQGCLYRLLEKGVDAYCAVNPSVGRGDFAQTTAAKKVMVVGGGIAGMEVARVAKMRGHEVALYEKTSELGGNLISAGAHAFKAEVRELNEWYKNELNELQVPIYLNTELDSETIKALKPDVAILAVGSVPIIPKLEKLNETKYANCIEVLNHTKNVGDRIIVVGGGLVGCELALEYIREGKEVAIVEALPEILSAGEPVPLPNRSMLIDTFELEQTPIYTNSRLTAIDEQGAVITNTVSGATQTLSADSVVIAVGFKPLQSIREQLLGCGIEVYEVGDGKKVGNILTAVWDAYEIACRL